MASFDTSVLKQPRWIAAIIVGVLIAVAFVRLGVWQLDRLDERRELNAVTEDRRSAEMRPFSGLLGQYGMQPPELIDRTARIEGVYRPDLEFFSVGRTYGDLSGTLVATPLELSDGTLVVIVRGLVPPTTEGPPAVGFEPPEGLVAVVGTLDDGEEPLRLGEPAPADGVVESISRIDLAYLNQWISSDIAPVSMVLVSQEPPNEAGTPVPIPVAELTEGS
ncbi:MAG: SURF1 family protein, partial [Acidimicrobiia bacterium]